MNSSLGIPSRNRQPAAQARPQVISRPDWLSRTVFPFEVKALDLEDARLTYIDEGCGPILVLVPGSPTWSFMFRATVTTLRAHFRCVVVDLPGLGLSQVPLHRGQAFSRDADWLQGFVRALDLRRFTLAVHATAGPPALEMAIREKRRIAGLVVTNSFAWSFEDIPKFRTFVRILTSAPIAFANVHLNLLPRMMARFGRRTRPFTPEERAALRGPYRSQETRRHLQNLLFSLKVEGAYLARVSQRLAALQDVPTLLLYGAHDHGYKLGFVERWQRLLPRHEVVLLEQSDHFAPEDQPDDYTAALAGWWHRAVAENV